jgi:hypothetical protein
VVATTTSASATTSSSTTATTTAIASASDSDIATSEPSTTIATKEKEENFTRIENKIKEEKIFLMQTNTNSTIPTQDNRNHFIHHKKRNALNGLLLQTKSSPAVVISKSTSTTTSASASATTTATAANMTPILLAPGDNCPNCKVAYEYVMSMATMVCKQCGQTQQNIDSVTMSTHGRENDNSFHYKRINHLNESLMLFQAKEMTIVPKEVIQNVIQHLYTKCGCRQVSDVTRDNTRAALRALGCRKYYENEAQILFLITGIQPPQMSSEQEERCRLRFYAIQGPFRKHCPPDRKNFFSYPYVLYKFCEMDGLYEFLPCFRLHKGREKREFLDSIWKKICNDLHGVDYTMPWIYYDTPPPGREEECWNQRKLAAVSAASATLGDTFASASVSSASASASASSVTAAVDNCDDLISEENENKDEMETTEEKKMLKRFPSAIYFE